MISSGFKKIGNTCMYIYTYTVSKINPCKLVNCSQIGSSPSLQKELLWTQIAADSFQAMMENFQIPSF